VENLILLLYGLFGVGVVILLVIFLVKRINNEKKEDFDKRDS